jgi:hypothetical protein
MSGCVNGKAACRSIQTSQRVAMAIGREDCGCVASRRGMRGTCTRQKRGEALAPADAKGNSTSAEQPQKCAQAQDRGSDAWPGYWPHTRGGQRIPRLVRNGHRPFVATWCSACSAVGRCECMAPAQRAGSQNNEARAILTRAFLAGAANYWLALPSRKSWETAATKAREDGRTRVRPERISL